MVDKAATQVLDRVVLMPLAAGPYVRVFEPQHGPVLQSNPNATGRLTRKQNMPHGATAAASWYIAETLRGALMESVLRDDVEPDDNGGVYLDLAKLAKCSVQWVERTKPGLVLRLEPGLRRHVVHPSNTALNQRWDAIIGDTLYELTHTMAGLVQLQALAEKPPVVVPGISFRSRLAPADIIYVMYDPPLDLAEWTPIGSPIALASVEGQQLLRDVLAGLHMVWLNDPAASGGTPPPGAI
jgi:hypothetical protein